MRECHNRGDIHRGGWFSTCSTEAWAVECFSAPDLVAVTFSPPGCHLFTPWSGPIPRGQGWVEAVNALMFETEVQAIRRCVRRNAPFGTDPWVLKTATTLSLESALRARGNPRLTGDKASDA